MDQVEGFDVVALKGSEATWPAAPRAGARARSTKAGRCRLTL
jgi:hypothetical protein